MISGYAYRPSHLTVTMGASITFANHDATAHTATSSPAGAFDTGTVAAGAGKTISASKAGTFTYYCQFHPFMRATITVTK